MVTLERRDLKRLLDGNLYSKHREDVKVTIHHYVEFSLDEKTAVSTVVDPYSDMPRHRVGVLVDNALQALKDLKEKEKST